MPKETRLQQIVRQIIQASRSDNCSLWTRSTSSGYPFCAIEKSGIRSMQRGHVIAARMFHGPRPGTQHALHSCHQPLCLNPRHIRWGTHGDNMRDSALVGGFRRALTVDDVIRIRESGAVKVGHKHRDGIAVTYADLAREYGVTNTTIGRIMSNKTWKNVGRSRKLEP